MSNYFPARLNGQYVTALSESMDWSATNIDLACIYWNTVDLYNLSDEDLERVGVMLGVPWFTLGADVFTNDILEMTDVNSENNGVYYDQEKGMSVVNGSIGGRMGALPNTPGAVFTKIPSQYYAACLRFVADIRFNGLTIDGLCVFVQEMIDNYSAGAFDIEYAFGSVTDSFLFGDNTEAIDTNIGLSNNSEIVGGELSGNDGITNDDIVIKLNTIVGYGQRTIMQNIFSYVTTSPSITIDGGVV
jgi:hypothetical protein